MPTLSFSRTLLRIALPISLLALVLTVACAWIATERLTLQSDVRPVLSSDDVVQVRYQELRREFVMEPLIVVVEATDAARAREVVAAMAASARADRRHYGGVLHGVSPRWVARHLAYAMPEERLARIAADLERTAPFLELLLSAEGLRGAMVEADRRLATAVSTRSGSRLDPGQIEDDLGAGTRLVNTLASVLAEDGPPERQEASPPQELADGLRLEEGNLALLLLHPPGPGGWSREDVNAARALVSAMAASTPDAEIGLTGGPVLRQDEVRAAFEDTGRATSVAALGLLLLFLVMFRSRRGPVLALTCMGVALVWVVGFAALTIGHVSVITAIALPMVLGVGIDFGLHLLMRYDEERRNQDPVPAMDAALRGSGPGIVLAAATSCGAFLAVGLTGVEGLVELARLATAGILLSLAAMLVLLPTALLVVDRRWPLPTRGGILRPSVHRILRRIDVRVRRYAWGVAALAIVLTASGGLALRGLEMDWNLLHLQADVDSVRWEKRLIETLGQSQMRAIVVASDVDEARRLQRELERLPTVSRSFSVASLIPEDPEARRRLIERIRREADALPQAFAPPSLRAEDLRDSVAGLRSSVLSLYAVVESRHPDSLPLVRDFIHAADLFLYRWRHLGDEAASARVEAWHQMVVADAIEQLALLRRLTSARPITLESLPPELATMGVGSGGRILIEVHPSGSLWRKQTLERFVEDVRSVAPDASGTAVRAWGMMSALFERYREAATTAGAVVIVLVLLVFRRPGRAALVLLPVVLAMVWTFGLLAARGVGINSISAMAVSLLLGLGVDNGIYMMRHYRERRYPSCLSVSTGRAVLLSNATSLIAFGSLMFGRHPGVESTGIVMAVGMAACLLATVIVLPAVLTLTGQHVTRLPLARAVEAAIRRGRRRTPFPSEP